MPHSVRNRDDLVGSNPTFPTSLVAGVDGSIPGSYPAGTGFESRATDLTPSRRTRKDGYEPTCAGFDSPGGVLTLGRWIGAGLLSR